MTTQEVVQQETIFNRAEFLAPKEKEEFLSKCLDAADVYKDNIRKHKEGTMSMNEFSYLKVTANLIVNRELPEF